MSIYMTGSYFHKKIILIIALASFLIVGFFPSTTQGAVTATDLLKLTNPTTAAIGAVNIATDTFGNGKATKNDQIYCLKTTGITDGYVPDISIPGCAAYVSFTILQVASWVLWVAAILFNKTLGYTLNMAGFIKDIPIVAVGWTTFRDVTNLMFVFIILYIAINTIVGNEGYGIKKLLGKVIVGAMLINFSLFFTQIAIDASNIFALQFYNKITVSAQGQNIASGKAGNNTDWDAGISAAFVNAMGLQQIYFWGKGAQSSGTGEGADLNDVNGSTKLGLNPGNMILVGLGGTVLVLITAFVFFAATFMFFMRTITLMFLMILSPVAFMGNILPALGKHTGKWWSKLTDNLLFAPTYMMLLYLVMSMLTSGAFKGINGKGSNFADMFAGGTSWTGAVMTFIVLVSLMFGCLIIAVSFGASGAKWAEKFAKDGSLSFGKWAGGGIARGGAGRLGDFASSSKYLANISARSPNSFVGRSAAALMQRGDKLKDVKIAGKSFNERVKEKQKDYTKRGNLIEKALLDVGDAPINPGAGASLAAQTAYNTEKTAYDTRVAQAKTAAAKAEKDYLGGKRFSYASTAAMKKAAKAAQGTDNKEALENLISKTGKWSQDEHNRAKDTIEKDEVDANGNVITQSLNNQIKELRLQSKIPGADLGRINQQLSIIMGEKKELEVIIKGHLDTVGKLSNLESK